MVLLLLRGVAMGSYLEWVPGMLWETLDRSFITRPQHCQQLTSTPPDHDFDGRDRRDVVKRQHGKAFDIVLLACLASRDPAISHVLPPP